MSIRPWADEPLALIPTPIFLTRIHNMWTSGASHMCIMHNCIFRGYNSIYYQASRVTDVDKADFIGYCLAWHKFVRSHAENEEANLFPRTEKFLHDENIFGDIHAEHDAFLPGLQQFYDYLQSLKDPKDFSGTRLLAIMLAFQEPFESHFRSEILLLTQLESHPNTPTAGSADEAEASRDFDAKEGMALLASGPTDVVPFFLFNLDREYENGMWKDWPPIPVLVRWTLIGIAKLIHPGWWKFASCDSRGRRKELYAVTGN